MRSRFVLAAIFGLVSSSAFGAAGADPPSSQPVPQGAITLTPTATLTETPSASASPTLTFTAGTPTPGSGDGGGVLPPAVPTLSPGMLMLLALGLATFAILRIRRL
jgi:hypothetical protein